MNNSLLLAAISSVVLGSLVYLCVILNWINVFSGTLFIAALSSTLIFLSQLIGQALRVGNAALTNLRLLIIVCSICLVGFEYFLRFGLNSHHTYSERNGNMNYTSIFDYPFENQVHAHWKNSEFENEKAEFTHFRNTNAEGLAEVPIIKKRKGEYRILALGDSFTEGVGTAYDSTWVKAFERNIHGEDSLADVEVINGGISGSDPFFEYMLLKSRLLDYKPDMVIVAINSSDVVDIITRGGNDRFQEDGTISFNRAPSWEWIYGLSYTFRLALHDVLNYSWIFLSIDEMKIQQTIASKLLIKSLNMIETLCMDAGIAVFFVIHPHQHEVANGIYYPPPFAQVVDSLANSKRNVIDLLQHYKIHGGLNESTIASYYWEIDLHHNAKGYELMGNSIAEEMLKRDAFSTNR